MTKIKVYKGIRRPETRDGLQVVLFIPRKLLVEANFSTNTLPDIDLLIRILELSEYELDEVEY